MTETARISPSRNNRAFVLQGVAAQSLYAAELDYVWNALRRLGVSAEDLEDLAQEVFLRVFRSFDAYDPSRPLRPWIFGVAMRVASDHRRLARHRREAPASPDHPDARDEGPGPHEAAERAQQRDLVIAALERLEAGRRAVFVLHELDECSIPEVADALGVPLNTCYSRLRLARADFSAAVQELRGGTT